jgi:hypothetical protein
MKKIEMHFIGHLYEYIPIQVQIQSKSNPNKMTSIHCADISIYDYNDVEKQLPEYYFPTDAREQYYIQIFPENEIDMDITNRFEDDTPDNEEDSEYDIETGKIHHHCSRLQSAPASSAIPIIMNYFNQFLSRVLTSQSSSSMQIHPEEMNKNTVLPCYNSLKCTLDR